MSTPAKRISDLSSEEKRKLLVQLLQSKTSEPKSFPLSFAQQRLWFFEQFEPGSAVYNLFGEVRLSFSLNTTLLERALNEIVRRHEVMRTTFATHEGQPVQIIAPSLTLPVPVIDLRNTPPDQREAEARRLATEESQRPFDLTQGPLLRTTLLRLEQAEYALLLSMHHIISDGWSIGLFFQELTTLYNAYASGQPSLLPELPIQYADFALWQRQWLQGEVLDQHLSYWREQLAGAPSVLALPTDRPRPAVQTFNGMGYSFVLTPALSEALQALSRQESVTLFMTLLAGFKTLLYRYTGQGDIVIGSPIANRTRAELESLIGFFVNTLVLRSRVGDALSFRQLLQQVREATLGAYMHQDLPFEKLVEELQPERNLSHNLLFQVVFALQNAPTTSRGQSTAQASPSSPQSPPQVNISTAKFDLTLSMAESEQGIVGIFEYNTDLFDAATITRMAGHLETLLGGVVANPDQCLADLPLLTEAERQLLLVQWNQTQQAYPQGAGVHELFEAQAEQHPEAEAVVYEHAHLTYRDLNRRANQVAHYLRGLGVAPEVCVGLYMERSLEMVVGLLGILKAGGVYVPLDPAYPSERLTFMLEDAQAPVLLTQGHLAASGLTSEATVVCLDTDWDQIGEMPTVNVDSGATLENLAYVIYTSGSTGRPKGTTITRKSFLNLFFWYTAHCAIAESSRVLLMIPIGFDASLKNLLAPLGKGGTLVLSKAGYHDAEALLEVIRTKRVTMINCTPSLIYPIIDLASHDHFESLSSLKHLELGGEPTALPKLRQWINSNHYQCQLSNVYGPTECADVSSSYTPRRQELNDRDTMLMGKPVPNACLYVVDHRMNLQPIGVPGELCIAGEGVARGYLNRPELTAEKFIANPFRPGERLYRTGDLVKWLADGNLEFLGRFDDQVKIRGIRIELGEIESVLHQHPLVHEGVVLAREDRPGNKRLVAYVVSDAQQSPAPCDLRAFLKTKLPEYMLPAAFVLLEAFPLSPNGKVDRQALPAPDPGRSGSEETFIAPRTPVEEVLAGIWTEVLDLERVGVHDNFFDLGGHSLLATQVISRMRDAFQVELPLFYLFERGTVAELTVAVLQDPLERVKVEKRAQLLLALNQMSDDEVEMMVTEKTFLAKGVEVK